MFDPNVSVERQARRHRPAIWGITVAVLAAILALFFFGAFGRGDGVVERPEGTVPPAAGQTESVSVTEPMTAPAASSAATPPATTTVPANN